MGDGKIGMMRDVDRDRMLNRGRLRMTGIIEGGLNATLMQPGKALVICGPAASGKTILARLIASQYGENVLYASIYELTRPFSVLVNSPDVLVVEDFELHSTTEWLLLFSILTSGTIEVQRQHKPSIVVPTPKHVIICTRADPDLYTEELFTTLIIGGVK